MRFWVRIEDVPSISLLLPKKNTSDTQLVGFHLSLPMGYIDSAPYFCMATDTVTDIANETIALREQANKHPLDLSTEAKSEDDAGAPTAKADASWERLLADQSSAATTHFDVYLDNFISVVHGGPMERCSMLRHLFRQIYQVFHPSEEADINRK